MDDLSLKLTKRIFYAGNTCTVNLYSEMISQDYEQIKIEVVIDNEVTATWNQSYSISDTYRYIRICEDVVKTYFGRIEDDKGEKNFKEWDGVVKPNDSNEAASKISYLLDNAKELKEVIDFFRSK